MPLTILATTCSTCYDPALYYFTKTTTFLFSSSFSPPGIISLVCLLYFSIRLYCPASITHVMTKKSKCPSGMRIRFNSQNNIHRRLYLNLIKTTFKSMPSILLSWIKVLAFEHRQRTRDRSLRPSSC